MKYLKLFTSAVVVLGLFIFLHFRHGRLPPLGKFLNPFTGFWQSNKSADDIPAELRIPGLHEEVQVIYDTRRVPHIFAKDTYDLYFAQGYLTARDRLWQMEIQTHSVAGRISEIIGADGIESDLFHRRIGMVTAAENSLRAMLLDPESRSAGEAYTAGVNAFINSLNDKKLPLEYKILDYKPEEWKLLKSVLILKQMSWTLSGYDTELLMTRTRATLGKRVTDRLYPLFSPFLEPIIPAGTPWNFKPTIPRKPKKEFYPLTLGSSVSDERTNSAGSNNWAVSGKLTESGYPILCNDPHLRLTLPAIWYEVQLVSPDVNVYGVSLPGTPGVIIGFNERVAWGCTNAESDFLDWYKITFKDQKRKEYLYEGKWYPTTERIEEIRVRNGPTLLDTVFSTHHGPIVAKGNEKPIQGRILQDAALRWTGHDPSNELKTFIILNRAKNYDDYVQALSFFDCPAQNFNFADGSGDIAIWHNGKFPQRWEKQGRTISDGSDPAYEWQGYIPKSHLPHIKNPDRGFVSSANQIPADSNYPYYLGSSYASFMRATRINEVLSAIRDVTPQDMIDLQNDVLNLHAKTILPHLLRRLVGQNMSSEESRAFEKLQDWNFENRAELMAPTIFEYWWRDLFSLVWKDDMDRPEGTLLWPGRDVTIDLILNKPESPYFDIKSTNKRETLTDLVSTSFKTAHATLIEEFGPMGEKWSWGKARGTDIMHLAAIPGLSRRNLATSGNSGIVNATTKSWGPSWRMVVSLGPEVHARGIYPGGQSGNPGSRFYDDMIDDWIQGKMYKLYFLKAPDDSFEESVGRTVMRGVQ